MSLCMHAINGVVQVPSGKDTVCNFQGSYETRKGHILSQTHSVAPLLYQQPQKVLISARMLTKSLYSGQTY